VLAILAVVVSMLWIAPANTRANSFAPVFAILLELVVAYLLWRRGALAIKPYAAAIPL
jgi:hypothetical protein